MVAQFPSCFLRNSCGRVYLNCRSLYIFVAAMKLMLFFYTHKNSLNKHKRGANSDMAIQIFSNSDSNLHVLKGNQQRYRKASRGLRKVSIQAAVDPPSTSYKRASRNLPKVSNKAEEDDVEKLKAENCLLRNQNKVLQDKNDDLEAQKRKAVKERDQAVQRATEAEEENQLLNEQFDESELGNTMHTQLLFLCCCIGLSLVFVEEAAGAPDDELSILLSIKAGVIDPQNVLKDWKMPSNVTENRLLHCNWTGVLCNSRGFVEKLDLSNMNLSDRVSDSIQGLRSLSSLNICCNEFASSLPKSLSNLTTLKSIDVTDNNFIGSFPVGLGKASGLTSVNASSNNFSGFIPEDLGNATSLESLDFRGSFFEGPGS